MIYKKKLNNNAKIINYTRMKKKLIFKDMSAISFNCYTKNIDVFYKKLSTFLKLKHYEKIFKRSSLEIQ